MKKRYLAVLGVVAAMTMTSIAWASDASAPIPSKPQVLHEWIKRPHPERIVKQFTPTGTPSPSYVEHVIIPYEADRYNTSPIQDRVECESGYSYNAVNGRYGGLIQTDEAYWYGNSRAWPSVVEDKDLGVKIKTKKRVKRKVFRVRRWDNSKKTYNRIGTQHVARVVIKKGRLPESADWFHGWAAIRVATRAVAGVGPTTYWACTHNGSNY